MSALHFELRIFLALALYWKWMVLPANWPAIGIEKHAQIVVVLGLALFAIASAAAILAGHTETLFGAAWFLITLAPLSSLFGHRSDYYLTILSIRVVIVVACGISPGVAKRLGWRVLTPISILLYVVRMVRMVTDDIYTDVIARSAFRAGGVDRVYLTPESRVSLHPAFHPKMLQSFVMEPGVLRQPLLDRSAVIYSLVADHLRNVTEAYRRRMLNQLPVSAPRRVVVGNPLYAFALGPKWGSVVAGLRKVPARATACLEVPRNGSFLVLDGTYKPVNARTAIAGGANPDRRFSHLNVTLDGIVTPEMACRYRVAPRGRGGDSKGGLRRLFNLPASIPGSANRKSSLICRIVPVRCPECGWSRNPIGSPVLS